MKIVNQKLPGNKAVIAPFGDLQYGNEACSVKYAERYLDFVVRTAKALKSPYYFIGMGDYMDLMSPSNRDGYRRSGIYASTLRTVQSRAVEPIMRETLDIISPYMRNHTIAICEGHHWMHLDEGVLDDAGREHRKTDTWLAAQLKCNAYIPKAVIVKLTFSTGRVYRIHACHGEGNGATPVYGLNKLSKNSSSWENIDCFAMGHTHKIGIAAGVRLLEEDGELIARQTPLLTSGAFMRSYLVNEVNYPESYQMAALPLGGTILYLEDKGPGPSGLIQAAMAVL